MAVLVSAHQLSQSFSARPLFRDLTFSIESGDRIGLIGPNGAGKSTLLRILASQQNHDDGTLSLQRGLKVGFLEQVPQFLPDATILSTILEKIPDALESGDWEAIMKAEEYISKFNLDQFGENTPITKLSGGWKKRVALARELMNEPDLLLLDEPTNHLDVESILWLEELLANARFAALTITHDRLFLQRISNRIIELKPRHSGGLLSVKGDYATFLETRDLLISAQERREVILKNTLRRETEWLRRGAKARTTKQQARITRHGELADDVQELAIRNQSKQAGIDFQSTSKAPKKLIEAKGISKSYGGKNIFAPMDLLLSPGTRIGLLGPNGAGKSTLIRILLDLEKPDTGTIQRSEHLSIAYFDQTRDALDPDKTLAKTLCPSGDHVDYRGTRVHIRGYLDRFLFTPGQMDMAVGKLSGGEQSRLLIAQLMLNTANLLVLDEPTNDLDMATLNVLEECLSEFPGAVILVTHDRYFLDQVATKILAFPKEPPHGGAAVKLVSFANLSQWEDWHSNQDDVVRQKESAPAFKPSAPAPSEKKRKLSFKEQRELETMESTIHEAEDKLARLTAESELPENARNSTVLAKLTSEMAATQTEIDRLYRRWEELAEN